jgi:hypothetical protein
MKYCRQTASKHYINRMATIGFSIFKKSVLLERSIRFKSFESCIRTAFHGWRSLLPGMRSSKELNRILINYSYQLKLRTYKKIFNAIIRSNFLYHRANKIKLCLEATHIIKLLKRFYSQWKTSFIKKLSWKCKEISIDLNHSKQLNTLKVNELNDLEQDRARLNQSLTNANSILDGLKNDISKKDETIYQIETLIISKSQEKIDLEKKLKEVQQMLLEQESEKDRLKLIESKLRDDLNIEIVRKKEIEDNHVKNLTKLKEEKDFLEQELIKSNENVKLYHFE